MRYSDLLGGGQQEAPIILQAEATAETVEIPNGNFFLGADYSRIGSDLMLEGPGGPPVLVQDYYASQTPPLLTNAEGAKIWPELVDSLVGPLAPAQIAQDRGGRGVDEARQVVQSPGGTEIGKVSELAGDVRVIRSNGVEEPLQLNDRVFQGDVLITSDGSSVGLTFIDNTLFSMTGVGRLVLDQLIFNPDGGNNELSLSLVQGVFAFVSGEIAGSDGPGMTVRTPVAVIGVRGTTGGGAVGDVPGTGDFQAIVALLAPLIGNLGGIDVIGNAVLTLFVELATAGILSNGDVQPTDFTPELQAALANAIVSLRISLARLIEEGIEPGAGGDDVLQGGSDADPAPNNFFTEGDQLAFGQSFGVSPIGLVQLLGLLEQLIALIPPLPDPFLPLTNVVDTGGEGTAASPLTALPVNLTVTGGGAFFNSGFDFLTIGGSDLGSILAELDKSPFNASPFIGFVRAETELDGTPVFSVLGGSAVDFLVDENAGTGGDPEYFTLGKFFKLDTREIGDGGEQVSLSFDYAASLDGLQSTATVSILVRDVWTFGEEDVNGDYVTVGTNGIDIIYANPFVENHFHALWSSDTGGDGLVPSLSNGKEVFRQVLRGEGGDDALVGTDGYRAVPSQDGNGSSSAVEVLIGGAGNDVLLGLSGDDVLEGGTGNDILGGDLFGSLGHGDDIFVYRMNENSGDDVILDALEHGFVGDEMHIYDLGLFLPPGLPNPLAFLDSPEGEAAGFDVMVDPDNSENVIVEFGPDRGSVTFLGLNKGGTNAIESFTELNDRIITLDFPDLLVP